MNLKGRKRDLMLWLGITGSGKSTAILLLANIYVKIRKEKVLLILPDYTEYINIKEVRNLATMKGIKKIIMSDENIILIEQYFRGGLVVFEDVRATLPTDVEQCKPFYKMLTRRRQKNIDIHFTAHGFTEVPPKLYTTMNYVNLFRTGDRIERYRKYILQYEYLQLCQKYVNKQSVKDEHFYKTIRLN